MLFAYTYINHDFEKMQEYVDYIFKAADKIIQGK